MLILKTKAKEGVDISQSMVDPFDQFDHVTMRPDGKNNVPIIKVYFKNEKLYLIYDVLNFLEKIYIL